MAQGFARDVQVVRDKKQFLCYMRGRAHSPLFFFYYQYFLYKLKNNLDNLDILPTAYTTSCAAGRARIFYLDKVAKVGRSDR